MAALPFRRMRSRSIVSFHCLVPLSRPIVSFHCLVPLSRSIVSFHCLVPLSRSIVSFHCLVPLSRSMAPAVERTDPEAPPPNFRHQHHHRIENRHLEHTRPYTVTQRGKIRRSGGHQIIGGLVAIRCGVAAAGSLR